MIDATDHGGLSPENTRAGMLQRECVYLMAEHERDGAVPTSIRFVYYELVARAVIPKSYPGKSRQPAAYVSDALTVLRELGKVPWSYVVDETRTLEAYRYAETIRAGVLADLPGQRLDLWDGASPPLILCESRSLAGVLRRIAARYLSPVAPTNGQVGGFLHTDIGPLLAQASPGEAARVLYFGDLDHSGGHIEGEHPRGAARVRPA